MVSRNLEIVFTQSGQLKLHLLFLLSQSLKGAGEPPEETGSSPEEKDGSSLICFFLLKKKVEGPTRAFLTSMRRGELDPVPLHFPSLGEVFLF